MKEVTYICDHCGKEHPSQSIIGEINLSGERIDICLLCLLKCVKAIWELQKEEDLQTIEEILRGSNIDNQTEKEETPKPDGY